MVRWSGEVDFGVSAEFGAPALALAGSGPQAMPLGGLGFLFLSVLLQDLDEIKRVKIT